MSRRAPRCTEQDLDWEESADCTDTLITMQQLPGLLLHLNTLSLFLQTLPLSPSASFSAPFPSAVALCLLTKEGQTGRQNAAETVQHTQAENCYTPSPQIETGVLFPSL